MENQIEMMYRMKIREKFRKDVVDAISKEQVSDMAKRHLEFDVKYSEKEITHMELIFSLGMYAVINNLPE